MSLITLIGQSGGKSWKKAARAALTAVLLSAIAIAAVTLFGSKVLAAWKAPGSAEQVFSGGQLQGLFSFEAPAATVARFESQKQDSEQFMAQTTKDPLLLKNWKFTQNPVLDFIQGLYIEGLQLELLSTFLKTVFPNSPLTTLVFDFTKLFLSIADPFLASLNLPPIPPVSPFF